VAGYRATGQVTEGQTQEAFPIGAGAMYAELRFDTAGFKTIRRARFRH